MIGSPLSTQTPDGSTIHSNHSLIVKTLRSCTFNFSEEAIDDGERLGDKRKNALLNRVKKMTQEDRCQLIRELDRVSVVFQKNMKSPDKPAAPLYGGALAVMLLDDSGKAKLADGFLVRFLRGIGNLFSLRFSSQAVMRKIEALQAVVVNHNGPSSSEMTVAEIKASAEAERKELENKKLEELNKKKELEERNQILNRIILEIRELEKINNKFVNEATLTIRIELEQKIAGICQQVCDNALFLNSLGCYQTFVNHLAQIRIAISFTSLPSCSDKIEHYHKILLRFQENGKILQNDSQSILAIQRATSDFKEMKSSTSARLFTCADNLRKNLVCPYIQSELLLFTRSLQTFINTTSGKNAKIDAQLNLLNERFTKYNDYVILRESQNAQEQAEQSLKRIEELHTIVEGLLTLAEKGDQKAFNSRITAVMKILHNEGENEATALLIDQGDKVLKMIDTESEKTIKDYSITSFKELLSAYTRKEKELESEKRKKEEELQKLKTQPKESVVPSAYPSGIMSPNVAIPKPSNEPNQRTEPYKGALPPSSVPHSVMSDATVLPVTALQSPMLSPSGISTFTEPKKKLIVVADLFKSGKSKEALDKINEGYKDNEHLNRLYREYLNSVYGKFFDVVLKAGKVTQNPGWDWGKRVFTGVQVYPTLSPDDLNTYRIQALEKAIQDPKVV